MLLDTPSPLEGAFVLTKHRALLVSDNCIMVSLGSHVSRVEFLYLSSPCADEAAGSPADWQ